MHVAKEEARQDAGRYASLEVEGGRVGGKEGGVGSGKATLGVWWVCECEVMSVTTSPLNTQHPPPTCLQRS